MWQDSFFTRDSTACNNAGTGDLHFLAMVARVSREVGEMRSVSSVLAIMVTSVSVLGDMDSAGRRMNFIGVTREVGGREVPVWEGVASNESKLNVSVVKSLVGVNSTLLSTPSGDWKVKHREERRLMGVLLKLTSDML